MSDEQSKFTNSRRRQKTDRAISRQQQIARSHGIDINDDESHRYAKHHAMDCGNPGCPLCGNPRRTHKNTLTLQEKRMYQDSDNIRDSHGNGLTKYIDNDDYSE